MVDFVDGASTREKCVTSVTELPAFVDPKQIPSKKQPFTAIANHPFVHTVEVILPENVLDDVQASLESNLNKPQCSRVFMYPLEILEHNFFNTYIKTGNILMISEGRPGSDTVFKLHEGVLSIEMGKEIYERTGLSGKPVRSGGRKHAKERFLVELNLRAPSMLHGKKQFERLERAFQNALNFSMAWLFCDLESSPSQDDATKPIQKHHPQPLDCAPLRTSYGQVQTPPLSGILSRDMPEAELQETLEEISEWIAMVQLGSPRVSTDHDVDPYLCRYSIPRSDESTPSNLINLKWHGLIPTKWTTQLFSVLLSRSQAIKYDAAPSWFVLAATALDKHPVEGKSGFTVAVVPGLWSQEQVAAENLEALKSSRRDSICWEFVGTASMGV
ncbi:hypothetical protein N7492_001248 [Penicillium capsulatum]|uniref:Uncharacterized protein n=1 Tax=Penicillium capsulatum TaxID=69766 RepID=A0A9W9ITA2_9EURO|nr:hypothetical protein N7492_001248 [Penicillium capsulatum]KAJ6129694.1 hypothetical protein N7512_002474 [Penicillium capsulatum]